MYLLIAAILGGIGIFVFRRWRKSWPVDPRLTLAYWRNSALVLGGYLLALAGGAGLTRIMVGFSRPGWTELLMVAFYAVWALYGAVWLFRLLPTTRRRPDWLTRSRGWVDVLAVMLLVGLAIASRIG